MRPPVLILGQGLTLLGVVRCFGRAGIPAFVLTGPDRLARRSRWYREFPAVAIPPNGYQALAGVLSNMPIDRAVLVPCSDPWAIAVGKLDPNLAARFTSVVSPPEVVATLVDKGRFGQALQAADVPHPRTRAIASASDLAAIADEDLDGCFLKPRSSVDFYDVFKKKACAFRGRVEAGELLARIQAENLEVLLQEFIPGPADRHYFVDGLVARDGGFTVLFARRRLRIYPPRFGNSTAMISVPLDDVRGAIESLEILAPAIGLRGIFSAEFKHDHRDDRFKLLEINPRPWWYVEYAATCHADVCVPAYHDAIGLPPVAARPYRVGVRLAYPYYDLMAWHEQVPGTEPALLKLLRSWIGATQPEWRLDDPWPGLMATTDVLRHWLARRMARLRRGDRT